MAACLLAAQLLGCASTPRAPAPPPNPALAGLQRLAALPFYGQPFDIDDQDALARLWARWWAGHYPGATWSMPSESALKLSTTGAMQPWQAEQAVHMSAGVWSKDLVRRVCQATGTDALMQTTIYQASTGSAHSGGLLTALNPLASTNSGAPSAARVAVTVTSCADGAVLWRRSRELTYSAQYPQTKMVEYVLGYVSDSLGEQ